MADWRDMVERIKSRSRQVTIAVVGKYVRLHDAYLSVAEALRHAGYETSAHVDIRWVDSETVTDDNSADIFSGVSGILVPGGFGNRGIEGKISAAKYAREKNVPYFGICLGMQVAVIEFARSLCGIADANSGEFDSGTAHKVIDFMPNQNETIAKGGTMRLGAYPCKITPETIMSRCYGKELISERHRHRYEFSNDYRQLMQEQGLIIGGTSPDGRIVETVELPQHPFYVGVQFHPEFKSRPNRAHPLFLGFVKSALDKSEN